jgi:hypothetical protein
VIQASLAIIATGAGITRRATGGGLGWLLGAVVLGAVVPFTLVVILPTNHRLLDASLDKASQEAEALLTRWGRLHALRPAVRRRLHPRGELCVAVCHYVPLDCASAAHTALLFSPEAGARHGVQGDPATGFHRAS